MNRPIHDAYYTKQEVAKELLDYADDVLRAQGIRYDKVLEPAVGRGDFFKHMPEHARVGIELDAEIAKTAGEGIHVGDFLQWSPPESERALTWVAMGNPPFGRHSTLAVRFFNHAAQFCAAIAFILPRSFMKSFCQSRLNCYFSIAAQRLVGDNAFYHDTQVYSIPCVFQIWIRSDSPRCKIVHALTHHDFCFVTRDRATCDNSVFAIQRVGHNTGRIKTNDVATRSPSSHHFILPLHDYVLQIMLALDMEHCDLKHHCAGCPTLGKADIVMLYTHYNV